MSYSRSQPSAAKEERVVDLFKRIQEDVEFGEGGENVGRNTNNTDTFALFVGEKDAGKTSLIQQFLGKDGEVKPTVALDYQFARRPRAGSTNNSKDISHVWELGGGLDVKELVSVPLQRGLDKAVVVIVMDCAKEENVIPSLNKWMELVRTMIDGEIDAMRGKDEAEKVAVMTRAAEER